MKRAGYVLGFAAVLWMLFLLWVRVMTVGDIGPAMRPYYDAVSPLFSRPAIWLILSAALACNMIMRLFRGKCTGVERVVALALTLLCLVSVFGWAIITALVAAA